MKKRKVKIILFFAVLVLITVFCWLQNNYITISEYIYESEKVSAGLDGYKIVHISDLHNKTFGSEQRRLIKKINECDPDMIVITGDIVDRNRTDIDSAVEFTREASGVAPVYYVTGNHERDLPQEEFKRLTDLIEDSGAVWLESESMEISAGNAVIRLAGLDNMNLVDGTLAKLMDGEKDGNITVLLAHQPQYIEYYSQYKPDIIFSGHAHGGQWKLPFVGAVVAPGQGFFPEYTEGSHTYDESVMYISRGLGNSSFPLRLFNYPEVVCVELKSE